MGSSSHKKDHKHKKDKKKKERKRHHSDEDSDRHRKRHKRSSRDRSRSRDRSSADRDRKRRHHHHDDKKEEPRREVVEEVKVVEEKSQVKQVEEKPAKQQKKKKTNKIKPQMNYHDEVSDDEENTKEGGFQESMSIEATNKLRAELGLAPLEVGGEGGEGDEEKKQDFVHKPAQNMSKKAAEEKLREKIRVAQEKRKLNKKFNKIKGLGESDGNDDMTSWVANMRRKEEERKRREEFERAQEEFGLTNEKKEELKSRDQVYTNMNLQGMEVEHDLSNFTDGKTEILVIKDKEILDEDQDDVLMSYDVEQVEKGRKFQDDTKKGRQGYMAYEDEAPDEYGFFKQKEVLGKYDEEIEGEKKGKFTIGKGGRVSLTWEQQKEQMKKMIRAKGETLEVGKPRVASDYLTTKEIEFKKKGKNKKKRKIRKKNLKADDLIPLASDDKQHEDHGSRASRNNADNDVIIDDMDEANRELEEALKKTREMRRDMEEANQETREEIRQRELEVLAEKIKQEKLEEEKKVDEGNYVMMNTTEEFCKKFQHNQLAKPQDEDDESEEEIVDDVKMQQEEEDYDVTTRTLTKKQMKYDVIMGREREKKKKEETHVALEEEPIAGVGLMGALQLCQRKGYIVDNNDKNKSRQLLTTSSDITSKNAFVEDRNAANHLDKYAAEKYSKDRRGDRDRGYGGGQEFPEKKDYKPKCDLYYRDNLGRVQDPKEAFRTLSHRFHGKGSGKQKLEKRMRKQGNDGVSGVGVDTPLNTVAVMINQQKDKQLPYVVLSGGGKNITVDK